MLEMAAGRVGQGDLGARQVSAGTDLMRLSGNARALLTAERSALNTVQHLTGIATMTRLCRWIAGTGAILLDTRKTIPGLRVLEKYATRMGGATNHRMGLWDAAMIKDNHVAVAGSIGKRCGAVDAGGHSADHRRGGPDRPDRAGLAAGATHLLLDNMDAATLRGAVKLGGRARANRGFGRRARSIPSARRPRAASPISASGDLTQSAPAADIGLDFAAA
jgi:nicotinate-nucleotide pyrophosphorylase (carboxylating)